MNRSKVLAVIDAPDVFLADDELAGDVLVHFYMGLGWNPNTHEVDPCKVRTTNTVYNRLYDLMYEKFPNALAVGAAMVNKAPGVDDDVPPGKVRLLDGWILNLPQGEKE